MYGKWNNVLFLSNGERVRQVNHGLSSQTDEKFLGRSTARVTHPILLFSDMHMEIRLRTDSLASMRRHFGVFCFLVLLRRSPM